MNRSLLLLLLLAAGLALVLRLPRLDQRPMHNDEAVNAVKLGQLVQEGVYRYDPNEHHGPTLYYAGLALIRLTCGRDFDKCTGQELRLETVLFGFGLLLLLPLVVDGLGREGTAWAALFTALSPALVFYSRYFIHETPLVFFTCLALAGGWRYWRSRRLGWLLLAAAALGLMQATKETFVITLAAAVLAAGLSLAWNRLLDAAETPARPQPLNRWHVTAGLAVWAAVAILLFTSFFTNASGPLDSLRTYAPWLHRAEGDSPHIHPWYFYLQRLLWFHAAKGPVWTEALIFVLALVGGAAGFTRRRLGAACPGFVRFLAFYTLLLAAVYSLVAYKTPWCLLSFWLGAIWLAGIGATVLLRCVPSRSGNAGLKMLLFAGAAHLAWQSWEQDTVYAADRRNPYVYAQTSPDVLNLVSRVEALAAVSADHEQMRVNVITTDGDCWPLPWYLRHFKQVGWWDKMPADPFAPVMIVSAQFHAGFDEKKTYVMPRYYELRPGVFLELYVEKELWSAYVKQLPPAKED